MKEYETNTKSCKTKPHDEDMCLWFTDISMGTDLERSKLWDSGLIRVQALPLNKRLYGFWGFWVHVISWFMVGKPSLKLEECGLSLGFRDKGFIRVRAVRS